MAVARGGESREERREEERGREVEVEAEESGDGCDRRREL